MKDKLIEIKRKIISSVRYFRLKFLKPLKIGVNYSLGKNCFASRKNIIFIGDNFYMGNNCHLAANALIGNDVLLASYVSLVGGDHKIDNINVPIRLSGRDKLIKIKIEDNVWVGHGSIILQGVTLSTGCVIAAGSVVTKNVGANEIWGGNPAKFIRKRL